MKRLYLLCAVMLLLILCACNHTRPVAEPLPTLPTVAPESPAAAPQTSYSTPAAVRLNMFTGGAGGTYYPYGWALALAVEESTGYIKTKVASSGASVENLRQISQGAADLAIVQNDVLDYAYNGTNTWYTEPIKNITTLMSLYPEYCQLIAATDSGVESVEDLRGKHISVGDLGSGVEANAIQILEIHGLSLSDVENHNLGFTASAEAMKNREIDAFFATSGLPNTAVMELANSCDIRIISIADDKIDALIEKYPFYTRAVIEENAYNFMDAPVNTVAVQATMVANPGLDEQVAYDIVKAVIENKDAIRASHAKGAFIDAEYAVRGVSVDFHPGARRYFEEIGVL